MERERAGNLEDAEGGAERNLEDAAEAVARRGGAEAVAREEGAEVVARLDGAEAAGRQDVDEVAKDASGSE